jgi:hypothetical protein
MPMKPDVMVSRPRSARPTSAAPLLSLALGVAVATSTVAAAQQSRPGSVPPPAGGARTRESIVARDDGVPRRLVARFDFEENAIFPKEIPTGFYRALTRLDEDADAPPPPTGGEQGMPGLRDFGRIEAMRGIGRAPAKAEPGWAVRFMVDGASMLLASDPSRIPVVPGAQVLVRAWSRTEGLQHANVRVSARFHDSEGRGLPGVFSSAMFRSEGSWRMLAVEPPPAPPDAAGLALWLEVVQPSTVRDVDEPYQVATDDVSGFAFFDDIEVWQVPTVVFEAESGGVVSPGTRAKLTLRCSDPSVTRTTAVVMVRDANDALVYQSTLDVPGDRNVTLEVPALATGWYEASVSFLQGSAEVSRKSARFTVLPDETFESDDPPRFGTQFAIRDERVLPAIELSRSNFAVLPVWTATTDVRDAKRDIESLRVLLSKLIDRRVDTMFRIAQVPATLARQNRVDADDALALFALDEAFWRPTLEPWLLAFGQQVDQWMIGTAPVDGNRGDIAARVESLAGAMRSAIAGPSVGLPWSPAEELPDELRETVLEGRHLIEVVVDPAWRENSGEVYAGLPVGPRGMARIQPLAPGVVDDRSRAVDLALRGIDAWRAGFDSIAVEVRTDSVQSVPGPAIELAAWRQLAIKLSGRRFISDIPLDPAVRCMLADGPRGPLLVAWSDIVDQSVEITADLGGTAVAMTDLWGRTSKVGLTPKGHVFKIGREPTFIEGVDANLCQLRRTFRTDPGSALSRRAQQETALVLGNPWPTTINGTITILGPEQLEITPRVHTFTIASGGEARLPINFSVPRSFPAGPTTLVAQVQGTATEPFRATLRAPLELGNTSVRVEPMWRLARSVESGSVDIVLTLTVTNIGDESIDVEAFAVADGYTQNRKPISALEPGETAVRVFHFASGAQRLSGRDIRAGVHDPAIDARHLIRVPIPPLLPPTQAITRKSRGELGAAAAAADEEDW